MAFTKRNGLDYGLTASTKENGLQQTKLFALKAMASTKKNGFQQTDWLPL